MKLCIAFLIAVFVDYLPVCIIILGVYTCTKMSPICQVGKVIESSSEFGSRGMILNLIALSERFVRFETNLQWMHVLGIPME